LCVRGVRGPTRSKGLATSQLERQVDLFTYEPLSDLPPRAGTRKPYLEVLLCLVRAVRSWAIVRWWSRPVAGEWLMCGGPGGLKGRAEDSLGRLAGGDGGGVV